MDHDETHEDIPNTDTPTVTLLSSTMVGKAMLDVVETEVFPNAEITYILHHNNTEVIYCDPLLAVEDALFDQSLPDTNSLFLAGMALLSAHEAQLKRT